MMTVIGVLMALAGGVGFVLTFMGIVKRADIAGNPTVWAVVCVIGIVLFFLTRRPSD
jgi:hypothetical protein